MKEKIRKLLRKKNAVLLAHNYQPPEIQDVADLCGDSLELSIRASRTDADVIVFCGVHFMAETACILSPEKTVLLPKMDAGCPMADMITAKALQQRLSEMPPGIPVVTYVNSPAEVKAVSTVCCTSANSIKVVNSLPEDTVFMAPDRNLAQYTACHTTKKILFWDGYCPIHDRITTGDVHLARKKHPGAVFIAHPECPPAVLDLADHVFSTSGMLGFAEESDDRAFIIGTESGLLYSLRKNNPEKEFFPISGAAECPDMKRISLADIVYSLENMAGRVTVPEAVRKDALSAVEKMISAV